MNDRDKLFAEFAKEHGGTADTNLLPPASWWDNVSSYLDIVKIFLEVCVLGLLWLWNFYLWLDIIMLF